MAPHHADFMVNDLDSYPPLPFNDCKLSAQKYAVKQVETEPVTVSGQTDKIETSIWFKSPPLYKNVIDYVRSIQLFTQTHDQGSASDETQGNWTWMELAIFETESSENPRIYKEVELVWKSHWNAFLSDEFQWRHGDLFDYKHDMHSLLKPGNVIGVRLCARFPGWTIYAQTGYLVFDISNEPVDRRGINYAEMVTKVRNMHNILVEVNSQIDTAFDTRPLPDNLLQAENFSNANKKPLRVLSLDGGGVRGLSSLMILKNVMEKSNPGKRPWEVFDIIGGTSTGGLIAIMLGRLKMTVDDCIETFRKFMTLIFKVGIIGKSFTYLKNKGHYYDPTVMETLFRELIKEKLGDAEALLFEADENDGGKEVDKHRCRVFVMAVYQEGTGNHAPLFLRSYASTHEKSTLPNIKIWEAARATSAAPSYFPAISVDGYKLVDGGLSANNPLGWLWTEILGLFGAARKTNCFLSIGTGIGSNTPIPDVIAPTPGAISTFASCATNTQVVHILFRLLLDAFAPQAAHKKYWRLNIGEEIPEWTETKKTGWVFKTDVVERHISNYKDVGELDDVLAIDELEKTTNRYIEGQKEMIAECAKALGDQAKPVSLA